MAQRDVQGETVLQWERELRLSRQDLAIITRQLAIMLEAGVSLRKALEVLSEGAANESCGVCLERLLKCVESGWKLSMSMASFPRVFNKVYLAMVEVGEETGQLVRTLMNLARWLDREDAMLRQVRAAMTYPFIVLMAAAVLTVGFFTVIFPGFAEALQSVPDLPLLTSGLIAISQGLRNPLCWLAALLALGIALQLVRQSLRREEARLAVWQALSTVPLLDGVLRDFSATRFASAMTILLSTGVDILKSFRLACLASGSPVILADMNEGVRFLSHGGDLADFMKDHPETYPMVMTGLVMVGQESASLPEVFDKVQRTLSEDTEYRLEILTALLEPMLMAMVSVLVGLLVIGVAMPMYGLVNVAL